MTFSLPGRHVDVKLVVTSQLRRLPPEMTEMPDGPEV